MLVHKMVMDKLDLVVITKLLEDTSNITTTIKLLIMMLLDLVFDLSNFITFFKPHFPHLNKRYKIF